MGNPPSQVIDVIEKQSRDDGDPLELKFSAQRCTIHSRSFSAIYRNDITGTNISHESGSERTCFGNPKSVASVFTGLVAFGGVPFRYVVDPPHMTVHSRQQ